jgi:predicted GTPase
VYLHTYLYFPQYLQDKEIEKMKNQLENIEKITEIDLHQYNILLVGTIGAGKSSFCNTLASAFANEVKEITVAAAEQCSVTQKV